MHPKSRSLPATAARVIPVALALAALPVTASAQRRTPAPAAPSAPAPAPAAGDQEARARFERGLALYNIQDYGGALAEFQTAYDLSHRPSVLYNLGVTQQALHHYPQAVALIEQFLRDATLTPERRAEVTRALDEVRGFTGTLHLAGIPPGAVVVLDGERLAPNAGDTLTVGTGQHTLDVSADGYRDARETVVVAGGQRREVPFAMRAAGLPAQSSSTLVSIDATLAIEGQPTGATVRIDGRPVDASHGVSLGPGRHALAVTAPGRMPYDGFVEMPAVGSRTAHVALVDGTRLSVGPFVVSASVTGALGVATIVTAVVTQGLWDQFRVHNQGDAEVQGLADTGAAMRTATNVLLGVTCAAAVATVIVGVRTRFGTSASNVTVGFAPRPEGGAEGAVGVVF